MENVAHLEQELAKMIQNHRIMVSNSQMMDNVLADIKRQLIELKEENVALLLENHRLKNEYSYESVPMVPVMYEGMDD